MLKILIFRLCITILYHFSFFLILLTLNICSHISLCFSRAFAMYFSEIIKAILLSQHCSYKQAQDMWKCEACQDIHRVFDSQCHKRQAEKERIKRVTKHKSLYHVVRRQKELKTATSKTFTETFISLKSLMNNDLKRKQRRSTNESHLLSTVVTSENTIMNHLIKKLRSNELKSTSVTSLLISSSVKNLTSEASALQTLKRIQNDLKCKL